jgi:hypothetical protein
MDGNFEPWIYLQHNANYAKTLVVKMKQVFSLEGKFNLFASDFKSSPRLMRKIRMLIRNSKLFPLLFTSTETDVEEEDENKIGNESSGTYYNTLNAIRYYNRFLGNDDYVELERFVAKVSSRHHNFHQGQILESIMDPTRKVILYNNLICALRKRQLIIHKVIHNYIKTRDSASCDLFRFGSKELLPFLEIALRFIDFPVETKQIKQMFIGKTSKLGDEPLDLKAELTGYNKAFPTVLNYDRSGRIYRSILVNDSKKSLNNSNHSSRTVSIAMHPILSLYIHFYIHYCRNLNKSGIRGNVVFVTMKGTPWGATPTVPRLARDYMECIGLNPADYSLSRLNSQMYHYDSKVMWITIRNVIRGGNDIPKLFSDMASLSFPMATNLHKDHYSGFKHLHDLQEGIYLLCIGVNSPTENFKIASLIHPNVEITAVLGAEIISICKHVIKVPTKKPKKGNSKLEYVNPKSSISY